MAHRRPATVLAASFAIAVPARLAHADCDGFAGLQTTERTVAFCRVRAVDNKAVPVDCVRLDVPTGKWETRPIPPDIDKLPDVRDDVPSAQRTPGGAKVCSPAGSPCVEIVIPHAERYDVVTANAARTLLAARLENGPDLPDNGIETFDVKTGKHLASVHAWADTVKLLGDTLYTLQPCAAQCSGVLWNPRTGKRIADVGAGTAGTPDAVRVAGDIWAFEERASADDREDGVLFVDVRRGKEIRRTGVTKLAHVDEKLDGPPFALLPIKGGVLVLFEQESKHLTLGSAAFISADGKVRKFPAPACTK